MYAKVYRYKIKRNALSGWKQAAGKAARLYKKHGDTGKWLVIMKKEKDFISVIDISMYKTKNDFLKIKKKIDKDKSLQDLFLKFKKTMHGKRIADEDFEVLKS